jgi:hypothetical protein
MIHQAENILPVVGRAANMRGRAGEVVVAVADSEADKSTATTLNQLLWNCPTFSTQPLKRRRLKSL